MKRLAAAGAIWLIGLVVPINQAQSGQAPAQRPQGTTLSTALISLPIPVEHQAAVDDRTVRQRVARTNQGGVRAGVWAALARCESGGNATAHGSGGRYHGAFQFTLATWHSLGYTGDPHTYPFEVQATAARRLQARSGWSQWPACSRRLGLR